MFKHLREKPIQPGRVVILGAGGFVGSALVARLCEAQVNYLALGRKELDLCEENAAETLAKKLQPDDALVIISAKAPCKDQAMFLQNIQLINAVADALIKQHVAQVIYISSDAVYGDSMSKLTEASPTAPTSLHGVMHLAREKILETVVNEHSLAILRPSLLYGINDPHNGYGPNRFYRLMQAGKPIELFGQGEELRDHVDVDDVAALIYLSLQHRSHGILNITSGEVVSFYQIAELINQQAEHPVAIQVSPRLSPMPHNGFRAFDNALCQRVFAHFRYTPLPLGLKKMHQAYLQKQAGEVNASD